MYIIKVLNEHGSAVVHAGGSYYPLKNKVSPSAYPTLYVWREWSFLLLRI